MLELTDTQAELIMTTSRIPEEILSSSEKVAVIATQDWCPQWLFMKSWLKSIEDEGIKAFYICYNRKPYFQSFMEMKENHWENDLVPYVRYYKKGELIDESNYVSKLSFLANFN